MTISVIVFVLTKRAKLVCNIKFLNIDIFVYII